MAIDNYLEKGKKFLAEKKYQEAIALYQIVLQIEPNNPTIYLRLGKVLTKINNFKEATSCYRQSLKVAPLKNSGDRYS
jgi:tetratricopeptide (TPR) repeat protein